MYWQDKLDEAAREAAKVKDPAARDAIQRVIAVVDEVAREVLPRKAESE
jgi:hypothetical protein